MPVGPLQAELDQRLRAGADGIPALAAWLLEVATQRGASDLHLEPRIDELLLRWRIDGCLADAGRVPGVLRNNLLQRLKVLSGLLTYRTDIPQDGRIDAATVPGLVGGTDMRVSVYPAVLGEKIVVRIFRPPGTALNGKERKALDLAGLGLSASDWAAFEGFLARPQGLLLLTGPAGSGKTTTLYAALRTLVQAYGGARQIVTIEDPVEQILPGVTHTELKPASGLDYSGAIKALLRQDPEVIMVGELRDGETAQVAVQAALTGHLILGTVHAPSAPEVLLRLMHLGVEPYLAASVVSAVLAQRLVRKLCEHCREAAETPVANFEQPSQLDSLVVMEPFIAKGCTQCSGTGFHGRLLVAEWLAVTGSVREAIMARAEAQTLLTAAAKSGWRGLWARGLERVRAGETTVAELRRVLMPGQA